MPEKSVFELCEYYGWELKHKATGAKGREFCGACPMCGGKDRFIVWVDDNAGMGTWWCRQCGAGGDNVELLHRAFDWDYARAFEEAGRAREGKPRADYAKHHESSRPKLPKGESCIVKREAKSSEILLDPAKWRESAGNFLLRCQILLKNNGKELAYLKERGIDQAAVKKYGLGWNCGEALKINNFQKDSLLRPRKSWGLADKVDGKGKVTSALWIPRGIVIPTYDEMGNLIRLRIRRPKQDRERVFSNLKYYVVPGSDMTPMFLPVENPLMPDRSVMMVVEAELDAICVHSCAYNLVSVLGATSAAVTSFPSKLYNVFMDQGRILVATDVGDASGAGDKSADRWMATFKNAVRYGVPYGKDPGEFASAGGNIREWVIKGLGNSAVVNAVKNKIMVYDAESLMERYREGGYWKTPPPGPLPQGVGGYRKGGHRPAPDATRTLREGGSSRGVGDMEATLGDGAQLGDSAVSADGADVPAQKYVRVPIDVNLPEYFKRERQIYGEHLSERHWRCLFSREIEDHEITQGVVYYAVEAFCQAFTKFGVKIVATEDGKGIRLLGLKWHPESFQETVKIFLQNNDAMVKELVNFYKYEDGRWIPKREGD